MSTFTSVAEYKSAILAELEAVGDAGTRRTIRDLLAYAEKTEKEAENRELRPRPDGSESADYYREAIDFNLITLDSLENLILGLLDYLKEIEES